MPSVVRGPGFYILLLALVACAQQGGPAAPSAARVEVSPAGVLLTPGDPERLLTARVFDQFGAPFDTQVTWSSSSPADIGVSEGLVTAKTTVGSAVITARAGKASTSVIVVAAEPAPGTLVVGDDEVVGDPSPVDDSAEYGPGFRYVVTLTDAAAVTPGTLLLGSGEKPVAGRVVEVVGNVVTLEVTSVDELFGDLQIEATVDLSTVGFVPEPATAAAISFERAPSGALTGRLDAPVTLTSAATTPSPDPLVPAAETEFVVGPFKCKAQASVLQMTFLKATFDFTPSLTYELAWNRDRKTIVVGGQPTLTLNLTPVVSAAFDDEVNCKLKLGEVPIPLPGPLGLFFGGAVPLGVGFKLGGKVPLAEVGIEATAKVGAAFRTGIDCNPECGGVHELTPILEGDVKPKLPAAWSGLRSAFEFKPFLFASLEVGTRFRSRFRVEAVTADFGPRLQVDLASEETQANEAGYASFYAASLVASVGAGSSFDRFLGLVNLNVATFTWTVTLPLGRSPTGRVRAGRNEFRVGDTVGFSVDLDPANIDFPVIGYNVESVRLYRRSGNNLMLANEAPASSGQTRFSIPWVATVDGEVASNFVAFVNTKMPLVPRLELADAVPGEGSTGTFSLIVEDREESRYEVDERNWSSSLLTERQTYELQLELVSEAGGELMFTVVGGSISIRETAEYKKVSEHPGPNGDCPYIETELDTMLSVGSLAVEPGSMSVSFVSGTHGGAPAYQFQADGPEGPYVPVVENHVWSEEYEFLGEKTDCQVNLYYSDTHDEEVPAGFSSEWISRDLDLSGNPLADFYVDEWENGGTSFKRTVSWSLARQ